MPSPFDFLKALDPRTLYGQRPLTPEEQSAQDAEAERQQAANDVGHPWEATIRHGFEGGMDFLKGLAGVDTVPHTPEGGAQRFTPNGAAQLLSAALPFAPLGIKGMFSRVNRVAEALPETGTAASIASKFKNAASNEEIDYRGLKGLLTPGAKKITKPEVVSHLEQHPLDVSVKKLGTVTDPNADLSDEAFKQWFYRKYAAQPSDDAFHDPHYRQMHEHEVSDYTPTKYQQHTLPGGQNYREDLITLKRPTPTELPPHMSDWTSEDHARNAAIDAPEFTGGHFDEPNVLAHVRHNERELPGPPRGDPGFPRVQPTWEEFERNGWKANVDTDPYAGHQVTIYNPEGHMVRSRGRSFNFDPQDFLHEFAIQNTAEDYNRALELSRAPSGPKGRFIEEIQSDWHQKGKREGYQTETTPEKFAQYLVDRHGFSPERASDYAVQHTDTADSFWSQFKHEVGVGVPDAPFKESWPDLALKQQVLDVAERPDLSWLGFTTGQTQGERYNLRHVLSKIDYHYDPESHAGTLVGYDLNGAHVIEHTTSPEDLPEYIGKEAADRLLRNVIDDQTEQGGTMLHRLENSGLEIGGEGMKHFYDDLLPSRLSKILKPFGGKVERGELPGTPASYSASAGRRVRVPLDQPERQGGFTSHIYRHQRTGNAETDNAGAEHVASTWPLVPMEPGAAPAASEHGQQLADYLRTSQQPKGTPAWIAHLPPDMKAAILKKGLPLLSLLGLYAGQPEVDNPAQR